MTIHNIGYQGEFSAADVADLDLGADAYLLHQDDLKAGQHQRAQARHPARRRA